MTPGFLTTAFNNFTTAIIGKLKTQNPTVDGVLNFGERYYFTTPVVMSLPSVVGRTADSTIHLAKAFGVKPTIQVNPGNPTTVIKVKGVDDTSILYDVDYPVVAFFKLSENAWYI